MEVDIYTFTNYREYLKAWYESQRAGGKPFSFRIFSKKAGFASPSYLKMVMEGQRNIIGDSIVKFARALKLSKKQMNYFTAMVSFNQATAEKDRDYHFKNLMSLRPLVRPRGIRKEEYEYFAKKYFVVAREMVDLPDFQEDPKWIASRFSPPIKPLEAKHAVEVLLRLGLLKRKDGKLVQTDKSLTTPDVVKSIEAYLFHRTMLGEAKEAMVRFPPHRREIGSVTMPLSFAILPRIKKRIIEFQEEIIDIINEEGLTYDEIYQLNIQLFPVTHKKTRTQP